MKEKFRGEKKKAKIIFRDGAETFFSSFLSYEAAINNSCSLLVFKMCTCPTELDGATYSIWQKAKGTISVVFMDF